MYFGAITISPILRIFKPYLFVIYAFNGFIKYIEFFTLFTEMDNTVKQMFEYFYKYFFVFKVCV